MLICGLSQGRAAAQNRAFTADFEAPSYQLGSIHRQHGWSVEQGIAQVTAQAGRHGGAGLVLAPTAPFSQATLLLAAPSLAGSAGFVDCYVAPTATALNQKEEMLDIDSARIGFFRSAAQPNEGRFWVFKGDGAGSGAWQETAVVLPVDPVSGRPADWVRLTLREDFTARTWDFWVNQQLAAASLGFQEAPTDHTESYVILGDAVERLVLDDLTIGGPNPLGIDTDSDGMLDAEERRIGSDPTTADRAARDAAGSLFEEKWMALPRQEVPTPVAPIVPPVFSVQSSAVTETFSLSLASAAGTTIYYTLDGRNPLPAVAFKYAEPLVIANTTVVRACVADAAGNLSATVAGAWVFPAQVISQKRPPSWPKTLSEPDPVQGGVRLFSLDPELQGATEEGVRPDTDPVAVALLKAPIVVLSADPDDLFGPHGIYQNSANPRERKVSGEVLWMDSASGVSGGTSAVQVSISGQDSRSHRVTMKHSLRLQWAEPAEAGGVFGEQSFPCCQFLLRHPTHDSWVVDGPWRSIRTGAKYISDSWAASWMGEQGHSTLKHHWVHLFLNGTYWGVYDAVEQHDSHYAQRHHQVGPVPLIEPDSEKSWSGVHAIVGNAEGWIKSLRRLREVATASPPSTSVEWESAARPYNEAAIIDYVLWNWWLANGDWPTRNWLASQESGAWTPLSWDAEMVLPLDDYTLPAMDVRLVEDLVGPCALFVSLCEWPIFRERVKTRLLALTAEDGALAPSPVLHSWEKAAAQFRPLVAAESARWGALYQSPSFKPADWEATMARVSRKFFPNRSTTLVEEVSAFLVVVEKRASDRLHPAPLVEAPIGPVQLAPSVAMPLDSDGDGMSDEWELRYGLNPQDSADVLLDPDNDGVLNGEECFRSTSPLQADVIPMAAAEGPSVHTRFSVHQRRRITPAAR